MSPGWFQGLLGPSQPLALLRKPLNFQNLPEHLDQLLHKAILFAVAVCTTTGLSRPLAIRQSGNLANAPLAGKHLRFTDLCNYNFKSSIQN